MLKKLIAYQRLLLNSTAPISSNTKSLPTGFFSIIVAFVMFFMNFFIFSGNTTSTNSIFPIALPVVSIWMINRILYGSHSLFETVPVSRKYVILNVFLLSVIIIFIGYIAILIFGVVSVGFIFGIAYLVNPQGFNQSPPTATAHQIISTTKGELLMLLILVIILFAGIAITFIMDEKLRLSCFAGFAVIGYGLLSLLKFNMPISPNSDKVEFLESFSVMPQGNIILISLSITTIIICISSIFISYRLYKRKGCLIC